jgi:hypothetical protein
LTKANGFHLPADFSRKNFEKIVAEAPRDYALINRGWKKTALILGSTTNIGNQSRS